MCLFLNRLALFKRKRIRRLELKFERLRRSSYLDLAYGLLRSLRTHRVRAHLQNNCIVYLIERSREALVVSTQSHQRPRPCMVQHACGLVPRRTRYHETLAWGFLLGVLRRTPWLLAFDVRYHSHQIRHTFSLGFTIILPIQLFLYRLLHGDSHIIILNKHAFIYQSAL